MFRAINQAEYAIRIEVIASQEYVNTHSTRRVRLLRSVFVYVIRWLCFCFCAGVCDLSSLEQELWISRLAQQRIGASIWA